MKIKVTDRSYEEVMALPREKRKKPLKPSFFFRTLLKVTSVADLKATHFSYTTEGMERLGKHEPCLILMNHSSFIDLKIAVSVFYHRPMNIVCTSDGFVGKAWLMRHLGCIPATKFVSDFAMVKDMKYALDQLGTSILMYPEASYSFDGTVTDLPASVGKSLKFLKVPVVMVKTYGAFSRDPLYNNLQLRDVKVSAEVKYLLSPEEIASKTVNELNAILKQEFTFDNFRWQIRNKVRISEPFRADYLNRVLYRCPHCGQEGQMLGKGTTIRCEACGKTYELTEYGELRALEGESAFSHVPDWYTWERSEVQREIVEGTYRLSVPVEILMLVDTKSIYRVGDGVLTHDSGGFTLDGCDGKLHYVQSPSASYSLYADYFWYELGDMICIGDTGALYYCFPKVKGDFVAKTRLATELLYKASRRD